MPVTHNRLITQKSTIQINENSKTLKILWMPLNMKQIEKKKEFWESNLNW